MGSPSSLGWAQIHDFIPQEPEKREQKGRLIAIISIKSKIALDQEKELGREILTRFHEEYYGSAIDDSYQALKKAAEKLENEFASENLDLELAAAAIVRDSIYLVSARGGKIILLRQGSLIPIVNSETSVVSASGKHEANDIFVLGTSLFFKKFSLSEIKPLLERGEEPNPLETLLPELKLESSEQNIAGVSISFGQKEIVQTAKSSPKNIKLVLLKAVDKLIAAIPEKKLTIRSETLSLEEKKKKTKGILLGIILTLLLLISVGFGLKKQRDSAFLKTYEPVLIKAAHEYDEAKELFSLSPARARDLILSARSATTELTQKGIEDPRLTELAQKINQDLGKLTGIYEVTPERFLDLSIIDSGFEILSQAISDETLRILDGKNQKLIKIEISTKKTTTIAGKNELFNAFDIAAYSDRDFTLSEDGIREIKPEVELVIKPDWDARNVLINAFAGNLYVLDRENSLIYRYPGTPSGFGEKTEWLAPGINLDLSEVVDWSIDGSVWILKKDGSILKLELGSPKGFRLVNTDKPLINPKAIFIQDELEYLYILDSGNQRILVVDKDGNYKAQYTAPEIGTSEAFIISEKDKKALFFPEANKIYSFELKHLN